MPFPDINLEPIYLALVILVMVVLTLYVARPRRRRIRGMPSQMRR